MPEPSRRPESDAGESEPAPARYYNDAVMGLDLLFEAAQVSGGALEELHHFADDLVAHAGRWQKILGLHRGKAA